MAAVASYGATISIGGTSVSGVTDITPPSYSRGTIDVTHLGSSNHAKEYIPGLLDGSEMSVTVICGAGTGIGTVAGYVDDYGANEAKSVSITLPDSGGSCSFNGIVTKVQMDAVSVGDNTVKATISIKPTGQVTYSLT